MREQRPDNDPDQQDNKRGDRWWTKFLIGQALQAVLRKVLDNWSDWSDWL